MAQLQRSRVSLRIAGDDLDPSEISRLLGAEPSYSQTKGQELAGKSGVRIAKFGQWSIKAAPAEPENMNGQVESVLGQLSSDLSVWQSLSKRFGVDLFCGWFMGSSNEGLTISANNLKALGERGIELSVDLYSNDQDA